MSVLLGTKLAYDLDYKKYTFMSTVYSAVKFECTTSLQLHFAFVLQLYYTSELKDILIF